MTERKPPGMSFESWVEHQISRSLERGDFDDLPGAGKPLPRRSADETVYDWVIEKARKENLDVFGMLPPGLALRKEREDLPRRAAALPSEPAVRALVEDYNARVQEFWRRPQESRWSPVPGLADVDDVVAGWRLGRPEPAAALPASAEDAARRPRSWLRPWRRRRHRER